MASGITVKGINHLGLAPKDPAKARWFLKEILGLEHLGDELVKEQKTMTIMFTSTPAGSSGASEAPSRLEILSPAGDDSPIGCFLEKKGSGIHHLALSVDDIDSAVAML